MRFKTSRIVTLVSDFGTADGYVGAMKGAMLTRAPNLKLVDVGHDIAPQDIEGGSAVIATAAGTFPSGTVHLVVVDPGVGTSRDPIVIRANGQLFVGPDNGVFSSVLLAGSYEARCIDLEGLCAAFLSGETSQTFHGRDIFAPIAALLSSRMLRFQEVGPCVEPVILAHPSITTTADYICGVVVSIDRFGNCITNLCPESLSVDFEWTQMVTISPDVTVPWVRTYGQVDSGEAVALVGSAGFLEIAVRDGSAAAGLNIHRGQAVRLRRI